MDTKIGSIDTCMPSNSDICCPTKNGDVSTVQTSAPIAPPDSTLGRHLARRLVQIGANDVFSVPGDFNLTLLDHLIAEPGLNLIGCCNELNAGYAADGYARSRGVGACVVTFTVGGLSVLNAIAGAYSENLPVICIVGGPNSNDYGTNRVLHHTIGLPDFSQELRCFQTVTCFQAVVNNLDDAHELIDTAISTALKESKPVYISIGCNLPAIPHPTFSREPVPFSLSPKLSNKLGLHAAVEAAAEFLNKSVKPVMVGGPKLRVSKAADAFVELADASGYALAVMPSAKGQVPEHHPHFIGTYWGAVSTAFCAEIVESADAYLFAGPIFNDYSSVGYSLLLKREKAIIVQPDRVVIGNGPAFGCVLMKDFLRELAKKIKKNTIAFENYSRIFVPEGKPLKSAPNEPLRVNVLFQHIQNMLASDTAVIAETGDSWFNCQKLKLPEGCGYEFQMQYGSIGWSVGATLGYAQAVPEKRVLAFIGDGSFQVTAQDVSTMLRCGQKSIIFLINNGGYTIEVEIHDGPYNVIKNWNYTALVDAIHNGEGNCWTAKVFNEEQLVEAISTATGPKKDCFCFIEVVVHKDDTSKELLEWGSRVSAANSRIPKKTFKLSTMADMTSLSLSKPFSFLPPFSHSPQTFTSALSFPLSKPSLNLHFRPSVLRSPSSNGGTYFANEHEGTVDEDDEEFLEFEGYVSEGSDYEDEFVVDEEELEAEARVAVREFSRSISNELGIEDSESHLHRETGGKQNRQNILPRHIPDHLLPKVAIFGRPNVGKSALFNRLVGGNKAIVVDEPGVTRDRLYGRSFWGDHEFLVIDTGGVVALSKSQEDVIEDLNVSTTIGMEGIPLAAREAAVARMPSQIERQAAIAVEESSVIIFVVDGQAGLTAGDVEIADWLRKNYSKKNIILAVNKCESPNKGLMQASEFWALGLSPMPISAISGSGTGELLDLVCSGLARTEETAELEEETYIPSIAIVGRPNVGKSSILNALVGEDRTVVSPISGTTRDAIDTEFTAPDGQKFRLIDTAGIRRKAAVASSGSITESLSVNRAFRAIRRSDVVALVIEAMACITEQDYKIAERIEMEGKGCLIVVNKWDTIPNKNQQTAVLYEQDVRQKIRSLHWAPIVYAAAISGQSVDKILVAASIVEKERARRLSTATLNQVVREAVAFKAPPRTRAGKRGRIYYCTQAAIRPPTFVFFVNDAKLFPDTYRRYMEKQLRTDAGFSGTPIRLLWRSRRKSGNDNSGSGSSKTKAKIPKYKRKEVVNV